MKSLFILVTALALSGCVTASERIARQAAEDDQICATYGVPKGSQPYVNCRLALQQQRADRRAIAQSSLSGNAVTVVGGR